MTEMNPEGDDVRAEIIRFTDDMHGETNDLSQTTSRALAVGQDVTASLGRYLERPVKIAAYTWSTSTFSQSLQPWDLFTQNPYVLTKLHYFSRIRANLKIRVTLNGSSFNYGMLRMYYKPMNKGTTSTNYIRLTASQLPGVYIEPQKATTVEMTLPFIWPGEWLNLNSQSEMQTMGTLYFQEYSALQGASGSVSDITLSVFAYMTDIEMAGPTIGLAVQSKDEYEDKSGTISGPLTTIANIAGLLTPAPVIGPFALATQIATNAGASIARLFGYSNPPIIDDVMPYHPKAFHAFANSETRMPLDRLCLDPKNEVTIDGTTAGFAAEDSLTFANTIGRESWVNKTTWDYSISSGTDLIIANVAPAHRNTTAITGASELVFTPSAYFGKMFKYWRGSMIYKIKFVKTSFHRGKVMVSWDPNKILYGNSDIEAAVFTNIIDISVEDEVEITVPYKASLPYLELTPAVCVSSTTPTNPMTLLQHNGQLVVRVLNVIAGPTATPSIDVHMFVRPGPDMEYIVPINLTDNLTTNPVQSSDFTDEQIKPGGDMCKLTVGESYVSLRPLLHRTSYYCTQPLGQYLTGASTYVTAGQQFTANAFPRVPLNYGFTDYGFNWANEVVGVGNSPFNYVAVHPMRYVLNCFLAYRGSTNVHFNSIEPPGFDIDSLSVERYYSSLIQNPTTQNRNRVTVTAGFDQPSSVGRITVTTTGQYPRKGWGQGGLSLTNTTTQSALSVNVPQQVFTKFILTDEADLESAYDGGRPQDDFIMLHSNFITTTAGASNQPWPSVEVFYGAGVDFQPYFFLCCPPMYDYGEPNPVNTYTP
jgi:hypothetical protein